MDLDLCLCYVKLCDVQYVCASHIRTVQLFSIMTLAFKNCCIILCIINLLIFREHPLDICGKNQKSVFCALCSIPGSHHVCFSNEESFCEGHPVLFLSFFWWKKRSGRTLPSTNLISVMPFHLFTSCITYIFHECDIKPKRNESLKLI